MDKSKTKYVGDEIFNLLDTYVKIGISPFSGKYCLVSKNQIFVFDDVEQLLDEFRHLLPEMKVMATK